MHIQLAHLGFEILLKETKLPLNNADLTAIQAADANRIAGRLEIIKRNIVLGESVKKFLQPSACIINQQTDSSVRGIHISQ